MAKTGTTTTQGLRSAIERSGYYPALVCEAVESAVGTQPISSYLVHQETTFDANEVRRHVTVLVLTETRFIVSHTDEQAADETSPVPFATDLEPAGCSDPNCDADHGYTGSATADDLSLRVSEAGDGPETVAQALAFARALSEATVTHQGA
jgi:hypothetical protein